MKIAAIGDIHGKEIWKDIVQDATKKADKIVLLGDYIDPYPEVIKENKFKYLKIFESYINKKILKKEPTDKELEEIQKELSNDDDSDEYYDDEYYDEYGFYPDKTRYKFKSFEKTVFVLNDIIEFKKKNKNDVILILGNHDTHYMYNEIHSCTRYDYSNSMKYDKIYRTNKNLFQYAYQEKDYLFIHAGISNRWLNFYDKTLYSFGIKDDYSNLGDVINKMGKYPWSNKLLNIVSKYRGGVDFAGGPTWADYNETCFDYVNGLHQIVGHNQVNHIHTSKTKTIPGSITYCDVLNTPKNNMSSNYYIVNV